MKIARKKVEQDISWRTYNALDASDENVSMVAFGVNAISLVPPASLAGVSKAHRSQSELGRQFPPFSHPPVVAGCLPRRSMAIPPGLGVLLCV